MHWLIMRACERRAGSCGASVRRTDARDGEKRGGGGGARMVVRGVRGVRPWIARATASPACGEGGDKETRCRCPASRATVRVRRGAGSARVGEAEGLHSGLPAPVHMLHALMTVTSLSGTGTYPARTQHLYPCCSMYVLCGRTRVVCRHIAPALRR